MRNAQQELLSAVAGTNSEITCAVIHNDGWRRALTKIVLPIGFSQKDYNTFMSDINFDYDAGYGGQELFGIVWLEDGTWLERGEYDGSEWWEHKVRPDIPEECLVLEGETNPNLKRIGE